MDLSNISIKDILLQGNYITPEDIKKAETYVETHHITLLEYLLSQNIITKPLLGQAIAEHFGEPFADIATHPPTQEQVLLMPEEIARQYSAIVFDEDDTEIVVATASTNTTELSAHLKEIFPNRKIVLAYALPEDIEALFIHYMQPLANRLNEIVKAGGKVAPQLIDQILQDAYVYRASDIHMEPHNQELALRFRVDGVLKEVARLPLTQYENILNRIKVLAKLRTDEHFAPQDGSVQLFHGDQPVSMRVSIVPTLDGEKIVIRLLSAYIKSFSLTDLGLSQENYETVLSTAKKPFGMILVIGPTGSGKTTTLYALLNAIDNSQLNITTIEDPVEYKIPTINQIQVDLKTDLTFAKGLRSVLRQDPNIILVGEIRDRDTAEIAINAALTGHLLFSTFHANDAATAIPRLLDIGVEPFLVSSTLELIVAQRLVRRICDSCRYSAMVDVSSLAKTVPNFKRYFPEKSANLYAGKGCSNCQGSGFRGRVAVFELITVTEEMKELILKRPSTNQLWDLARKQGSRSLFEDGIDKVKNGITTIQELMRVAPVDQSSDYLPPKNNSMNY